MHTSDAIRIWEDLGRHLEMDIRGSILTFEVAGFKRILTISAHVGLVNLEDWTETETETTRLLGHKREGFTRFEPEIHMGGERRAVLIYEHAGWIICDRIGQMSGPTEVSKVRINTPAVREGVVS